MDIIDLCEIEADNRGCLHYCQTICLLGFIRSWALRVHIATQMAMLGFYFFYLLRWWGLLKKNDIVLLFKKNAPQENVQIYY